MPRLDAIRALVGRRIQPSIEERRLHFARALEGIESGMALKGLGRSGALLQTIHDACVGEIEGRTWLAWSAVKEVLAATGVQYSETLASELLAIVDAAAERADVREALRRKIDSVGGIISPDAPELDLDAPIRRSLAKRESDIDLYVLALAAKLKSDGLSGGTIINNFLGPVGAYQVGSSSIATVNLTVTPSDTDALRKALALLERSMGAAAAPPAFSENVLELVQQTSTELAKPRPNLVRAAALAGGIATTIQTAGALQPAYQALKSALSSFGIHLP
jgi:hypothetical protein